MDAIFSIAQELSNGSPTVERAIERIVDRKRDSCPRSLSQVQRRLYAAANWVWHEIHHQLPVPLSLPRKPISTPSTTLEQRVFTTEEIDRMKSAAPSVSVYADALVRILFTTGVRIAAVGRLRWSQLQMKADGAVAATVIALLEKGGRHHMVLLTEDTRHALELLFLNRRTEQEDRVFPVTVRQLRNIFYRICKHANVTGNHCHPHAARHTVAHQLFHAGNSVALISKFLGHRSIHTTGSYYLRLRFLEVIERIHLPWAL